MPRGAAVVVATVASMALAAAGRAYTGGPELVDVLGYDAATSRVYFHREPHDDAYRFGGVYWVDLRSGSPRAHRVAWSRPDTTTDDASQAARLAALSRRLRRLEPELHEALPSWHRGTVGDTITVTPDGLDRAARFRVHVEFAGGASFDVTTYHEPDVAARAVYPLPGGAGTLWVLSFRGRPRDTAPCEVPVWVAKPGDVEIPVRWVPEQP